jgi:hypothetical protein
MAGRNKHGKEISFIGLYERDEEGAGCKACFFSFRETFTDEKENQKEGGLNNGRF